jgi:Leucine-rich repeat (LRR) protein
MTVAPGTEKVVIQINNYPNEFTIPSNRVLEISFADPSFILSLDCSNNLLTSLDVSNLINLQILDCSNNSLSVLDVSNNAILERLDCYNNSLTSLDVSNNARLAGLDCSSNSLSYLDVSKNARLRILSASEQRAVAEVFFNGSYGDISFNGAAKRISIGQDFSFHLPKGVNSGAGFSGILVGITHVATYADFFIILFLVTIIAFVVWMFLRKRK